MSEIKQSINITLKELYEMCLQFKKGDLSPQDIKEWEKRIKVTTYLTLNEKMKYLSEVLFRYEFDGLDDNIWRAVQLEQYKFWYLLLRYTNIVVDGYEEYCNIENYDIIFPIFGDWILSQCFTDYNRLIKIFDDIINFGNIENLLNSLAFGDKNNIENLEQQLEYMDQNQDKIKNIVNILYHK